MKPFHEFIWTVRDTARELRRMNEQLNEMRQLAYSLRGISYDGISVTGGVKKANDGLITAVVDLERYCTAKQESIYRNRLELELFLDKLPPLDRDILKAYYVDQLTQEKAAEQVGYSLRQYQTLQGEAYQRARDLYEAEKDI